MNTRGPLLVLEGPDGSGKSTLAGAYASYVRGKGQHATVLSFPGQMAGTLGSHIYALHHEPARFGVEAMTPESLQALHVAAHLDSIDRLIRPALDRGDLVILDRYWWSTWVYGRESGAQQNTLDALIDAEMRQWADIVPAGVVLVTRRTSLRTEEASDSWRRRVDLYARLAAQEGKRYPVRTLSNDGAQADAIQQLITAMSDLRSKQGESGATSTGGRM